MGIQVDDVYVRHIKSSNGEKGTQRIGFEDGTIINLICKTALMSFQSTKPTMDEVINKTFPIYDIAQTNWNPRIHYDDINALPDESSHAQSPQKENSRLFHTVKRNLVEKNDTIKRKEDDDNSTISYNNSSMPFLTEKDDDTTLSNESSSSSLIPQKHFLWVFDMDSLKSYNDDIINNNYTSNEDILANNIHIPLIEKEMKKDMNTRISNEDLDTMAKISIYINKT